jgi:hypothetical protein
MRIAASYIYLSLRPQTEPCLTTCSQPLPRWHKPIHPPANPRISPSSIIFRP